MSTSGCHKDAEEQEKLKRKVMKIVKDLEGRSYEQLMIKGTGYV